jgi:hypothetical protein
MAVNRVSVLVLQKSFLLAGMVAVAKERRVEVVLLAIAARVMGGVALLVIIVAMDVRVLLGAALELSAGVYALLRRLLA